MGLGMEQAKSIICISTHFWHDYWFRKQHFMSRFAEKGYRVLYVQPTHSMVRKYRKPELSKNRNILPSIERLNRNIILFNPPKLLPKPMIPTSSIISHTYISWLIGKTARRLNMSNAILWVYRPEYASGLKFIPHNRLVFDLADDLASYKESAKRRSRYVANCISKIAFLADQMIVTSPTLQKLYQNKTKRCALISNGFDEKLFDGQPKPIPKDLAQIPKPVAGFVGTLFSYLDYQLLYQVARSLPEVSFVFVGPVESNGKDGVALVNNLSNTYFLGPKNKESIPDYVSNFTVCLNPFKEDNVSKAVSPLKVYEYLATGRPVISTPMEGLAKETAGKWVHFVRPDSFKNKLEALITNNNNINYDQIEAAREFSWTSQFNNLLNNIEDI